MVKTLKCLTNVIMGNSKGGKKFCWTLSVQKSQWAMSKQGLKYRTEKNLRQERGKQN